MGMFNGHEDIPTALPTENKEVLIAPTPTSNTNSNMRKRASGNGSGSEEGVE